MQAYFDFCQKNNYNSGYYGWNSQVDLGAYHVVLGYYPHAGSTTHNETSGCSNRKYYKTNGFEWNNPNENFVF